MLKRTTTILCFLLFALSVGCSGQTKSAVTLRVDWATYLAQHDLLWDRVPADYFEGAFVGKGLLAGLAV